LNGSWTKVSNKRGRPTQEPSVRETKHTKENEHWLSQTSTSNRYTAPLEAVLKNTAKLLPIYIAGVQNISPVIQPVLPP
jgi:hypothetical protein